MRVLLNVFPMVIVQTAEQDLKRIHKLRAV